MLNAGKIDHRIFGPFFLVTATVAVLYFWLSPNPDALAREAKQALWNGDVNAAIKCAQTLVALKPDSAEAWNLLVDAGRLAQDQSVWKAALVKLQETDSTAAYEKWLKIGTDEMRDLHAGSAEFALRQAISISREKPEPWRLMAQLLAVQGRPQETSECLLSLIRLNSFTRGDLLTLGWPNSAIDDPARTNALLNADPQNLIPMLSKVGSALNENRTADAEKILRKILDRHPHNGRAIAILGKLLAERDGAEFAQWQHELAPHATTEPEALIAEGIWLRNHGQTAAAAGRFHRAVELDPRHLGALSELGQTMQSLGESEVATAILERARLQQEITELSRSVEEQGDAQFIWKLIQRLNAAGRYWEAWAWCQIYVQNHPGDAASADQLLQLRNCLKSNLPRTASDAVPGQEFAWSKLAEPDWNRRQPASSQSTSISAKSEIMFHDVARQRGIEFHFENGPDGAATISQTSGGGVAALDYDRDGWCDLYFTQGGKDLAASEQKVLDALFRNDQGHKFIDETTPAAVREQRFSQGVAAGDMNNDGFPDIYVANLGQNRLLENNGDGTFTDVTVSSGLKEQGWTTSCAMADLNEDGSPELFSVRYAGGSEITSRVCYDSSGNPGICRPTLFPAETDIIAISSGDGRYVETCEQSGLDLPDGRGFGLVIADFDDDRKLDVFVANDQTANYLLIQDKLTLPQLRFSDQAVSAAVAFDHDGFPQACMGIASADLNHDGRPDLYITNFENESNTLYTSQPYGGFVDSTRDARLRDPSFDKLGFGTQFMDADLDGYLDLIVLNGHILNAPEIGKPASMLPQFFRGLTDGRFEEVRSNDPNDFFEIPRIGRGLCVLDWNRDGLPEFAASCLDGNAVLATNGSVTESSWLHIDLVGVKSSRDAIGTRIQITSIDGKIHYWQATAGHGFAASNESGYHLGLGAQSTEIQLQVEWPSGEIQRFKNIQSNVRLVAIEGRSILLKVDHR